MNLVGAARLSCNSPGNWKLFEWRLASVLMWDDVQHLLKSSMKSMKAFRWICLSLVDTAFEGTQRGQADGFDLSEMDKLQGSPVPK